MPRATSKKPNLVLVVEDDPNARKLLTHMLSAAGHKIVETDLVITDLGLPNTTGSGIIMHAHAKWPQLPVILITGYLGKTAAQQLLNEYVEYIPKPLDRDRLLATVDRFVSKQI